MGADGADPDRRRLLLRDEGLSQLSYVDLGNPTARWTVVVPTGRDLQLVGGGRAMIGTDNGYEERAIATGAKMAERTNFPGTLTAHRVRSGNTLLAGVNWQGGRGIVIVEVNAAGAIQRTIMYPAFPYVRLVRETSQGTYMVTSNRTVFEGKADGTIVWQADITSTVVDSNAWKALRLSSGDVVVTTGYAANIQIFGSNHMVRQTISGPSSVTPHFFSDLQVLPNGNYFVTNWQGHSTGNGNKGRQLLEFSPEGTLVWSWAQDATFISSLQAAIILDGLDTSKLHVEDTTGMLVPVQ